MKRQRAHYDVSVIRDLLWYASNIVDNESLSVTEHFVFEKYNDDIVAWKY